MAPRKPKGVMLVENMKLQPEGGLASARSGDLARLRTLVEQQGWDAHNIVDKNGSNALLWASGAGHLHVVGMSPRTC